MRSRFGTVLLLPASNYLKNRTQVSVNGIAFAQQMGPEAAKFMGQSPLAQLYPEANWEVLFTKLGNLLRQEYDWSKDVAAIKAPVMLAFADADAVQPSHIIEFFNLLDGGLHDAGLDGSKRPAVRLAILPGTTHYDILSTATLASLVKPFLDAP